MNSYTLSFSQKSLFLALFCATGSLLPMRLEMQFFNPPKTSQLTSQIIMGELSLLNASRNGNEQELTQWIALGVDINARNGSDGFTALHFAADFNYLDIGKVLLKNNKIIKNLRDYNGNTALHIAVQKKHLEFVALLLQHRADQTIRNNKNLTPMSLLFDNHYHTCEPLYREIKILKEKKTQPVLIKELVAQIKKEKQPFYQMHTELLIARLNETIGLLGL